MAESEYRTGYLQDAFDSRDYPLYDANEFETHSSDRGGPPASVQTNAGKPFILPDLPPVYDQQKIGSCTANAACAALRYAHRKYTGKAYSEFEPSRLFAYYWGRVDRQPTDLSENETLADMNQRIEDGPKTDSGSNARRIIHTFLMRGVCTEGLWPYGSPLSSGPQNAPKVFDVSKGKPNPVEPLDWDKVMYQARPISHPKDGKSLAGDADNIPRAISYYRIFDPSVTRDIDPTTKKPVADWQVIYNQPPIALLEKALSDGFPFIFGTRVYEGARLANDEIDENGVFKIPSDLKTLQDKGGHALMCVGFDSTNKRFLIQNSWGTKWPANAREESLKGRCWIPYEWFQTVRNGRPITYDFWVIKSTGHA